MSTFCFVLDCDMDDLVVLGYCVNKEGLCIGVQTKPCVPLLLTKVCKTRGCDIAYIHLRMSYKTIHYGTNVACIGLTITIMSAPKAFLPLADISQMNL